MKNLISTLIFGAIFLANSSFAQHHDHAGMDMDHSGRMKMDQATTSHEVDVAFQKQLGQVYQASLILKNSFIKSSSYQVINAANEAENKLNEVNMHLLKGDAHMEWMKDLEVLESNLEAMKSAEDIAQQRKYFAAFNQGLYHSIKSYGINEGEVYYQYCPMALDNQGAYWLSDIREIQNPYFGEKMLSCGSVKDVLEF